MIIKTVNIIKKEQCCGCKSCYQSCPKNCISMISDNEGFCYPHINNDLCINCGICLKKCPAYNENKYHKTRKAYGVIGKDSKLIKRSSSGGVFIVLAEYVVKKMNGYVVGSIIDDNGNVFHSITNDFDIVKKMQGSKYVESDLKDTFPLIKSKLKEDKLVLFTGTPCQNASLISFLGRHFENLILVDLICHGVPSQKTWLSKFSEINNKYKQLGTIQFRYKDVFNKTNYSYVLFNKKNKVIKKIPWYKDGYYSLFVKEKNYRPSCYSCDFKKKERVSDMTIGDLGSWKYNHSFFPDKATSCLFVNTKKGEEFWNKVCELFFYTPIDVEREYKSNKAITEQIPLSKRLSSKELVSLNSNIDLSDVYIINQSIYEKFKSLIKRIFPSYIREKIRSIKMKE